jgi:transposase
MEWVALVGVDWGDQQHAYMIEDRQGTRTPGATGSSAEEVHEWMRGVRERYPEGTIVVALEQGCPSLIYALTQYEYLALVPINPRASKAYRDSLRLSGASDDRSDAALICEFAIKHLSVLRIWQPEDAATRELRMLAEHRRSLVDQRTAATHALSAALKNFFPQALQWFGGEASKLLLAVLKQWPTLADLRSATPAAIEELFRANRCRKVTDRIKALSKLLEAAVPLLRDAVAVRGWSRYAQAQVALIEVLDAQVATYDQAISVAWEAHPDHETFASLPGAGTVLAPRLAVAFGTDRTRYTDPSELQCYSGIAPVIEQSGKQRWVHARWGYPKFLHQTFHEFAQASLPHSPWAKAVYQQQREHGALHHEAIRTLAFRWLRILFRLWKDQSTYDESRHIERLRSQQSPVIRLIAA